jgi:helix-turn-helix protein
MELARGGGDKILTTIEAAEVMGVSPIRIRQLCQERKLISARRVELNERWVVLESDVRSFVRRPVGRPSTFA